MRSIDPVKEKSYTGELVAGVGEQEWRKVDDSVRWSFGVKMKSGVIFTPRVGVAALNVVRLFPLLLILVGMSVHSRADETGLYLQEIKPLLKARCYSCHGALKQESDLRLDTARSIIKAGIVEDGRLLRRVASADLDVRMPPEGEPLEPAQITTLKRWISLGMPTPEEEREEQDPRDHWAFQAVHRPPVPASEYVHPIDAILEEGRQKDGLVAQPRASRLTLVRRLYMDLVGMPPGPGELAELLSSDSPEWYIATVDRLLADPRHGERWGRHWMDIWRYSDWWGLGDQLRNSQKHIWHWRDWIIESLNDDVPYDEMIRQMLAADELYPNDLEKLRGSGYLARNWYLFNRNHWMEDTVEHVGKGFLGLTFNCAKCHDHKFDPIQQADFYRLRAFFEPYHVRTDMVPGTTDLAADGIPRPFDGFLDAETYLFVRGNDKHPDKSHPIEPGIPGVFSLPMKVPQAVVLPRDAYEPGRRQWVLEAYLADAARAIRGAEKKLADSIAAVASSKEMLEKIKNQPAPPEPDPASYELVDRFEKLDEERWEVFGGTWVQSPGELKQTMDGAQRAVLRLRQAAPDDFEAILTFVTTGGSKWRSVGIAFDAVTKDPTAPFQGGESSQNVYISGYQGGPKIHASYNPGGEWVYPPGGLGKIDFELNREYEFKVQVRGTLINAYLDGQLVVAWHTPLARRKGALQLTTFDVLPIFKKFSLRSLPPEVKLTAAKNKAMAPVTTRSGAEQKLAKATADQRLAELDLAIARQGHESMKLKVAVLASPGEPAADARQVAIRSQQQLAVLQSRRTLTDAEGRLSLAGGKNEAVEKEVAAAEAALATSLEILEKPVQPGATLEPFPGARWTPTRFFDSTRDDPAVPFQKTSSGRRTALAEWITDRENPLTARVAVNHIWMRHMGDPLVKTVFDFGRRGDRPTQPELLDWMAAELMSNDWSMKHLHRIIVSSEAYRMSSSTSGAALQAERDPENRSWWRRFPIRLESQAVRDSILSLAGTLDLTMSGPPVQPAQQAMSKRRSLYFFHSNNSRNLFLTMFDEALVKDCYRRDQSIVPQQALALTNSSLVLDSAGQIAARLSVEEPDDTAFAREAFATILGIDAAASELTASIEALAEWKKLPGTDTLAARTHLVWVLLNHNDFVTVR